MRILITGGHFSPAYALISLFKKRGYDVAVVGRKYPFEGDESLSFEYQICQKENLDFFEIKTGRFQRKFTAYTISSLMRTPSGFFTAIRIMKKYKPDVVLTFGGYIGLPVTLAASFLRIPVVLHEQTQGSGLSSKIISRIAVKICISFESSRSDFPESKIIFTGNPVRDEIFKEDKSTKLAKDLERKKNIIYITGGSTGSHFINGLILEILDDLLDKFTLVHQTGDSKKFNDFDELSSRRDSLLPAKKENYILRKFIYPEELGLLFKRTDFLLSRAGANTVFEIMATKKISLLIPLPHGQNNEQRSNAKLIKDLGIGEYIEQNDAAPQRVLGIISELSRNRSAYENKMSKAAAFYVKDAAERIAKVVEEAAFIKDGKENI